MKYGDCSSKSDEQLMRREEKLMELIENVLAEAGFKEEILHELLDIERELSLREGQ